MGAFSLPIQPRTNPYLDEIDAAAQGAHAQLSPGAQEALKRAGAPIPGQAAQQPTQRISSPPQNAPGAIPMGEPAAAAPTTAPIAAPARAPITPVPLSPEGQAAQGEVNRITAPDTGQHNKQNTGVSGINQIHSPWARIPLQIAEAIGTGFAPGLTSAIPGTQLHHNVLVNQAEGAVTQQQKQRADEEAARTAAVKATQEQAQGHLQEATAEDIEREGKIPSGRQYVKVGTDGLYDAEHKVWVREPSDPAEKGTVHQLDDGRLIIAHPDGTAKELTLNGQPVKGAPAAGKEGELLLGERVPQLNQALTSRYQVLHPKSPLPAQYQIPANATQKDYERIDKALESEERAVGTREQQAQTNEMRRQTMALAAGNAQNRQDTAIRSAGFKAYTPALDSAERFNVMAKNYEDAVKNHDQQAMLSLLANHLGMTMGLQKGSRLTRDIIREAETSRPWLQGMAAKFDKDGYLSGVNLTPTQMRQMVDLGRERFSEDVTKAHSEAAYQGVQDQGPARIPNKSTINHYTALANGDPKKAKELAAADGWTVQ